MTRIFQPDPARNPLAEAMAKLDAQEAVKAAEQQIAILDELFFARMLLRKETDPKMFRMRLEALHEQIGSWLEGDYE